MENKINIAELLKDCPSGMELDCTTWENVTLERVTSNAIFIKRNSKIPSFDSRVILNQYGCITDHSDEKCRIFPKGKTTWEGFHRPFKDGDIVFYDNCVSIFKEWGDETLFRNYVKVDIDSKRSMLCDKPCSYGKNIKKEVRFATEEEKQRLFDAIKANGYRWNAETKTLEKLPKFKVGDRIQGYGTHINHPIRVVKSLEGDRYRLDNGNYIKFGDEHAYKLLKFDITTLKPFDKVLYRMHRNDTWLAGFYNVCIKNKIFVIGLSAIPYCIPYEHNEHLLGTTNDCDDFYKTWEKWKINLV